jgi:septal ring factor EnvC (AmiA/AmiB activator)
MIPAYKEEVKITVVEKTDSSLGLEQKVQQLEERVRQMHETVQYMERERGRLKSEIEAMKHQLNKK